MRLLFVYPFCGLGGVETSILNKIDALRRRGIDAYAVLGELYGSSGEVLERDPRVMRADLHSGDVAPWLQGADAVSVIDAPGVLSRVIDSGFGGRVIYETHASAPAVIARLREHIDHPRVNAVVVPSAFNRAQVEQALAGPGNVIVIPNPIDADDVVAGSPRLPSGVVLPPGGPILLWIGRLEEEKNPLDFVRIGGMLAEAMPAVRLLMVGDAPTTAEYVAQTDRLRQALPATASLTFCRAVPYESMPELYRFVAASGGCLVSTSRHESAPMTFIEAMAYGCPVVSSHVGGVDELILDGETGLLFESGNLPRATHAIQRLTTESDQRAALTARARAYVATRHAPARVADLYAHVLGFEADGAFTRRPPSHTVAGEVRGASSPIVDGMVSVIIPVYNRAALLREAVASVLAQTYRHYEIVIVDDGSTDATASVCDALAAAHASITVVRTAHRGRAGLAREVGRAIARGEFIQYLDSDDLMMPEKLAVMVAALGAQPDADIAYCLTRRYRLGAVPDDHPAARTGEAFTDMLPHCISRRLWETSTPIYRRRLCDQIGPWTDLRVWEDIEYDMRAALLGPRLVYCPQWLAEMRDHEQNRLSHPAPSRRPEILSEIVRASVMIYRRLAEAGFGYSNPHVAAFVDDLRLVYRKCRELDLEEPARFCAGIVRTATGDDAEPDLGIRLNAVLEPEVSALRLRPGEARRCRVRVVNASSVTFHGGDWATELTYHLLEADGSVLRFENSVRVVFDEPLFPGESRVVELWLRAPNVSGLYYIELDVSWAGERWLNSLTGPTAFIKLLVGASPAPERWRLQVSDGSRAHMAAVPGDPLAVRVQIEQASGDIAWHIQLNHERVWVVAGERYQLRWDGRSDQARHVAVAVSRAHAPWDGLGLYESVGISTTWKSFVHEFVATDSDDRARVHFDLGEASPSFEVRNVGLQLKGRVPLRPPPFGLEGRLRMDIGTRPISESWGTDRGLPVHRFYLEQFLTDHSSRIRGRVLEFQDPMYAPRFGGSNVESLDILHLDGTNPLATMIGDLTRSNDFPSSAFDCVVCTHVLHVIVDPERALSELHRMLRPGGSLLVAVPHISMAGPEYDEIWRFTPLGLRRLLERVFGVGYVDVDAYGNSLAAAAEIRGVVSDELLPAELAYRDERFAVEVCARAWKRE